MPDFASRVRDRGDLRRAGIRCRGPTNQEPRLSRGGWGQRDQSRRSLRRGDRLAVQHFPHLAHQGLAGKWLLDEGRLVRQEPYT